MKDICEYFTPQRAREEDSSALISGNYRRYLDFVLPKIKEFGVKTVIEWGCRSGLVAHGLVGHVREYVGVDKNLTFLEIARRRVPSVKGIRGFVYQDVRHYEVPKHDLSCCWDFLKNFSLDEFDAILGRVLKVGKNVAFNVQLLDHDLDNGTEYHHVYIAESRLMRFISEAGFDSVFQNVLWEGELREHGTMKDVAFWLKEKQDAGLDAKAG